jgi:PLP dependent protein
MDIAGRRHSLLVAMAAAAEQCGRDPAAVRLIAVSKTHPVAAIIEAYQAGQRDFGENYIQELHEKSVQLRDSCPAIRWHFIGRVQSGNAKMIVRCADVVHGVGSLSQAAAMRKEALLQRRQVDALAQLNWDLETSKNGFAVDDFVAAAPSLREDNADGLRWVGLMSLPPPGQGATAFAQTRMLRDAHVPQWPELSMGMSDDFELAIAHGSTWVRVGSALFGNRPASTGA